MHSRQPTVAAGDDYRRLFDVPADIAYLNCASLAPRLNAVTRAGYDAVARMSTPWRIRAADWFADGDALRRLFAQLIGADSLCVALTPSVSYAVATAARNVRVEPGDNIVLLAREYPSSYYSWRRLARERGAVIRPADAGDGEDLTATILSLIDRRTAVVATPNCRWTDGALIDLRRIGEAARRVEAALVVDASQSLGAHPLDVAEIQPDFLVSVGYKWLLGPYGLGYFYAAPRWHEHGAPLEESWLHREGAQNFATLSDYTDVYKPGAQRFGPGESAQFYLLPMAIAALEQIIEWSPARIQAHLKAWTVELASHAPTLGFRCAPPARRVAHLLGLKAAGELPPHLIEALAERDVHVAIRGDSIRASPHLHASTQDLDRLIAALIEVRA